MKKRKKLTQEFKKIILTAIIAAFGLVIGLTWNDVINEAVQKIIGASKIQNQLISAILVTILASLGIWISTKLLSKKSK